MSYSLLYKKSRKNIVTEVDFTSTSKKYTIDYYSQITLLNINLRISCWLVNLRQKLIIFKSLSNYPNY